MRTRDPYRRIGLKLYKKPSAKAKYTHERQCLALEGIAVCDCEYLPSVMWGMVNTPILRDLAEIREEEQRLVEHLDE